MSLETNFRGIGDFNTSAPSSSDPKSQGDDHIRGIKTALATQFPNLGITAVTATASDLNSVSTKARSEEHTSELQSH